MSETTTATAPERILNRLEWQVIRRLEGLLQGDYRTLFYGNGLDFADLREYEPNDDIRHIDWNVTARMNTPFVRQYVEDRDLTAWFLLDLSLSMGFGTEARPKEAVLRDFVVTMARLLTQGGNRVGAILYRSRVEQTLPPRASRNQVLYLTEAMLRQQNKPTQRATDLTELLSAAVNTIKRRSLVFLVSDFISQPGWERPLHVLNRRHELVGVRLYDPAETVLPDAGVIVIQDAETGEQLTVDTSHPEFRRRFASVVDKREAALQSGLRRAGVDLHKISTAEDLVSSIVQMAALRKLRRRV